MTSRNGFTIVELLCSVTILGILAAVVIPQFQGERRDPREAALQQRLTTVRQAIAMYRMQHDGAVPGAQLDAQLTTYGDDHGPEGHVCGPYLRASFPENPIAGGTSIRAVTRTPLAPSGSEAWLYNVTSGEIRCNRPGLSPSGKPYYEF